MRKGVVAAGIIGVLILGILVGYFVLSWVFPLGTTGGRQKYFVTQNLDDVNQSVSEWTDVPKLNLSFTTLQNEEITFCYSSFFKMLRDPGDMTFFSYAFVFKIDGIKVSASEYYIIQIESNSTQNIFYPIVYRLIKPGMSAGTHNVSVTFSRSAGGPTEAWVSLNVLSVQIT